MPRVYRLRRCSRGGLTVLRFCGLTQDASVSVDVVAVVQVEPGEPEQHAGAGGAAER